MTEPRRRGPYLKGDGRRQTAARLRKEYEAGATVHQLATEMGRSYGAVHNLLREAGTEMRAWGFQPKTDD